MLTVKHIIVFWICCFTIVAALSYARRAELHRAPPPCPAVVTAPAAVYHYGPLSVSAQGAALTAACAPGTAPAVSGDLQSATITCAPAAVSAPPTPPATNKKERP